IRSQESNVSSSGQCHNRASCVVVPGVVVSRSLMLSTVLRLSVWRSKRNCLARPEVERHGGWRVGMAVAGPRRATQSLREAQKEFTRDKLVKAASEEFSRGGYVETTIDSIIDAAGTSRGTFYLYFDSKAKILIAAMETYWLEYA